MATEKVTAQRILFIRIKATTTEELLLELERQRQKFTQSDNDKMVTIIDELIDRGEYVDTPQTERRRSEGVEHPIFEMVNGYGANWNKYSEPHNCPKCRTDLCDRINGPPYKREIGRGGPNHCPECEHSW